MGLLPSIKYTSGMSFRAGSVCERVCILPELSGIVMIFEKNL